MQRCRTHIECVPNFGIWRLRLVDLNGNKIDIPFYITKGPGILLLGNEVLSKSDILNTQNLLRIPPRVVNGLKTQADLPIYTTQDAELRTHLHVVPCRVSKFRDYFVSFRALHGSERKANSPRKESPTFMGKTAKEFARKLHLYSHLPVRDMKILCQRGKILQPVLSQALHKAVEKCTSCKTTGRPLNVRKTSLNKLLGTFNDEVQLDYMRIKELTDKPILHIKDNSTGFCAAAITQTRDQDEAARTFEDRWITVHGPPVNAGYDPEYHSTDFEMVLKRHNIVARPRPARKHSKIGTVESGNRTLRVLAIRILRDAEHLRDTMGISFTRQEILSRATLACNVLRANKKLCPFELAKGHMPAIGGLSQTPVDTEISNAHVEQVTRRALANMLTDRTPNTLPLTVLKPKTKVYFFEKKTKQSGWNTGFVQDAKEHLVELTRSKSGKRLKIAYEDIRLFPSSSLLQELDEVELDEDGVLGPVYVEEEEDSPSNTTPHPDPPPDPPLARTHLSTRHKTKRVRWLDLEQDASLTKQEDAGSNKVEKDKPSILRATSTENPQKDIGDTPVLSADQIPTQLESQEQELLRHMRSVVGDGPVPESKLRFAPRWIIYKAIRKEKENYTEKNAFEEVNIRTLPKGANVITSHCFFQVKTDGESGKLKLKCRLVPHGNRDKEKDNIRKDSTTAQFPVIRALLSAAAILNFRLGTIDISGAFLQGGKLERDVYVRLPPGWTSNGFTVWKLLVPAYGLVESGRIWQLAVEEWMKQNGINPVPGMTQIFTLRNADRKMILIIAKVVDDFLIAGKPEDITKFHDDIARRFKVGRFLCDTDVIIFNRLHISQEEDGSITVSMQEYMDKIEKISLDRFRWKQQDEKCTPEELKKLQALAGQLNWLGHGVIPPAAYISSLLQQWTGDLRVKHLMEANRALHELRRLTPLLRYKVPNHLETREDEVAFLAFSYASPGKGSYGQTGYLSGIFFQSSEIYHVIDWHSSKQCRVAFSSIGAEILVAAGSADRAGLMAYCLNQLYDSERQLPLVLTVDSHGLYSTISTLHEGRDCRLRPTVARIRDSFETGEISVLQWIPGPKNPADALTKRNLETFRLINQTCSEGTIPEGLLDETERVTNGKPHFPI